MKCPKCGYLAFEHGDRCSNCGYEFSLSAGLVDPLDRALDPGPDESRRPLDLERVIGGADTAPGADLPLFSPSQPDVEEPALPARRPDSIGGRSVREDAPLITAPVRPRAPLGVRRATPEIPRARHRETRPAGHGDTLFEPAAPQVFERATAPAEGGDAPAGPVSRIFAALVDVALLFALDATVLYFTLRLLGLAPGQYAELPLAPLVGFLLLLNGGYFVAFTAVGGQSIGKMALGIKVISQEASAVPVGRAALRTLAYVASALPLGAGFLPGVFGANRLALHDRLAHTRVVRPSST
jgi:uncharacterized RDD family membrane protein YckC